MTLAISWPHDPGDQAHAPVRGGPMTLAIGWPHDGGETVGAWPHEPGYWQFVRLALVGSSRGVTT